MNGITLFNMGSNRYRVTDNATGFSIVFTAGDFSGAQEVAMPPADRIPEGVDLATYAATAMRHIGDYMATQHPELI